MFFMDSQAMLAQLIIEDRIRKAKEHNLAREVQPVEPVALERPTVEAPQRHSRLWTLFHFRHAYG